jgi:phosphatidylglycerol:prolipoprotein diacylglycerol transferase
MLFYDLENFLQNPLTFFHVWEGGMSSHGGILGLMIFLLVYAWIKKVNWVALGDGVAAVAPVGIFLVRIANFINGELYGRATHVGWAVQFPSEIVTQVTLFPPERQQEIFFRANQIEPGIENIGDMANAAQSNPQLAAYLHEILTPRHPSQLYEAFLEGAVLFAILWVLMTRFRPPTGVVTGLFFILYATFRILVENVREPDIGIEFTLGLTRGQFLSTFMIVIGAAFLGYAWFQWKHGKKSDPDEPGEHGEHAAG